MIEPVNNGQISSQQRKVIGQGFFVFGLSMIVFGLSVIGFKWPLGGRERTIDVVILAIFGPEYAGIAMVVFITVIGIIFTYKGVKMWRQDA